MAVQKPALTTALVNWKQRDAQYQQLGIPQSAYHQIAQQDISNVANTGATPMTTAEVNAAMLSQMAGHSVIGNPVHHSSGILGDIGHVLNPGTWGSDIQGILSGFIPGTVNFLHHLPSEITGTGALLEHMNDPEWLKAHGYDAGGGIGADLRNAGKSPILGMVPGVSDIADLTSASGRQWLMNHPISATLDVAPLGGEGGLVTRAARLGEEGAAGSAMEAAQSGQLARAGLRAGREALSKLPVVGESKFLTPEYYADIANQLGVSSLYREEVFRPHSVIGRQYSKQLVQVIKDIGNEVWGMKPEDRAKLFEANRDPNPENWDPRYAAILGHLHEIQSKITEMGQTRYEQTGGKEGLLVLPHGRGKMVFAAKSEVARASRRIDKISALKAKIVKVRQAELVRLDKLDRELEAAEKERINRIKSGQSTARITSEINRLRNSIEIHKRDLTNAQHRYEKYDNLLHERQEHFHDALFRSGGPAAIHPLVDQQGREEFKKIATEQHARTRRIQRHVLMHPNPRLRGRPLLQPHAKRYNPELYRQRQILQLQQLQTNLQNIDEATRFEQLKSAIQGPAYTKKVDLKDPTETGITANQSAKRTRAMKKQGRMETAAQRNAAAHGQELYDQTMKSVVANVLDLVAHGYDPIWMKHVEPGEEQAAALRLPHVSPLPDKITNPKQYNEKIFNWAPRSQDVALGLVAGAQELFRDQATRDFVIPLINNFGMSRMELEQDYLAQARSEHQVVVNNPKSRGIEHARTVAGHAQALMAREWQEIDPTHYGVKHGATRFAKSDTIMIPKALAQSLEAMMPKETDLSRRLPLISNAYDKTLKVFRFSVLTGPRHLVHVAIAGLLGLMGREPGAVNPMRLIQSWKLVHEGAAPIDLTKHIYDIGTDQIYNYAVGHQFGSWAKQAWSATGQKVEERLAKWEETASDVYRVSAYLSAQARGIDEDTAIQMANKVAVDMDDMAPWERTVMKQVFPFYAFTRFLFRYLLSYPADHPYRVSILTRFANQENEEWNTLLPTKFMQMLWMGHPDKNGNILTIDYKNLNPFRSFSNDFSMVGFFQSLNPILSAPFAARGFSTLTGVGDLYPQVQFNPQSGSLQAAPPSGRDQVMNVLEQFIPELGAVDHFLGITDQMKLLKRQNPQAYRSMLFSQLNIPFAPVVVNKPYVEEHEEINRYKTAEAAVSQAEKTNVWNGVQQFQEVPYQGQYVSPATLERYWQQLITNLKAHGLAGVDPRAVLATPIHRTSPNPLELLGGGSLPPQQSTVGM